MSNYYMSQNGAGLKDGSSVANAWDGTVNYQTWFRTFLPGDIIYIESGTYDQACDCANDGLPDNRIRIIGVEDLSTLVEAQGDDRPFINQSNNNRFNFDNYWELANLRCKQTSNSLGYGFRADSGALLRNCKFEHTNGINAFNLGGNSNKVFDCEFIATSGIGLQIKSSDIVYGCYAHDSVTGFEAGVGASLSRIIVDSCTTGIYIGATYASLLNFVIYNCTTGIDIPTGMYQFLIMNGIIDSCTTGINSVDVLTGGFTIYLDYNCYHNNTTDVSNVSKGSNSISGDPKFNDAPNGNFSLDASSPCIDTGLGMRLGVG